MHYRKLNRLFTSICTAAGWQPLVQYRLAKLCLQHMTPTALGTASVTHLLCCQRTPRLRLRGVVWRLCSHPQGHSLAVRPQAHCVAPQVCHLQLSLYCTGSKYWTPQNIGRVSRDLINIPSRHNNTDTRIQCLAPVVYMFTSPPPQYVNVAVYSR